MVGHRCRPAGRRSGLRMGRPGGQRGRQPGRQAGRQAGDDSGDLRRIEFEGAVTDGQFGYHPARFGCRAPRRAECASGVICVRQQSPVDHFGSPSVKIRNWLVCGIEDSRHHAAAIRSARQPTVRGSIGGAGGSAPGTLGGETDRHVPTPTPMIRRVPAGWNLSGWRDSNSRSLRPQRSALPTRPQPDRPLIGRRATVLQTHDRSTPGRLRRRQDLSLRFSRGRICRWIGLPWKPNSSRSRRSMNRT